ncbi:TonB-dependent receptor [Antarcticibacterium sp. 1MA-6-2]|uniref:TonB-dependent receptor n=1 Tax=Antarcticibacterium sp. 1MA-6-2 TaxID=2908210 RepID=UPI001F4155A6|nr:TonB-dependent receptor [Antarcticibacterium sp. 1MA-6-2]UJH89754.1 TonB-dependent receptor [Antarcticibacterium sp. 1MA-6-2]
MNGLVLLVVLSIENRSGTGKDWRAAQKYNDDLQPSHSDVSSFVIDSEFQYRNYEFNGRFNADFDITEDIGIDAIVGATTRTTSLRQSSIRADNLSIEGFYDVSNGTGVPTIDVDETERRLYGAYGEIVAQYKNFFSVSASGRYDATSTLPEAERAYFYPAYGASLILSDAIEGLRNNNWLNYFKIYGNNSTVYNDLAPYEVNETYSQSTGFPFGGLNGFFLSGTAVDSDIKKEKINTTEFGTNLAFFSNRITLDAAYFKTFSTDLITFTTPSVASASTEYLTNIGELEGDGFEVSLGAKLIRTEDFSWDVNVNYTTNKVVVNDIAEGVDEVTVWSSGTGQVGIYAIVGEEFPSIKASSYVRDPQGRVVVDEVSGNPEIGDLKLLGKTTPDYIVGLNSQIQYKGFSLSGTLDYRTGHVYYEQGSDVMEFTGRSMESVSANRQDFVWPNSVINTGTDESPVYVENTNIPITNGRMEFWKDHFPEIKENYIKDATALKIREVALNYSLPKEFLGETLTALRVGVVGRNLLTWLPAENRFSDPEFNNANTAQNGNAIGVGGYFQSPPTRSVGVSVNVEF